MIKILFASALPALVSTMAQAESISLEAVFAPVQSMKMDFADGSKHFVLMVRRESVAKAEGSLDGAASDL